LKPQDGCTAHQKLIASLAQLEGELSEEECSSDLTITKSNFTGAVAIGPFSRRHCLHDGSRVFNLRNVSLYAWNGEQGVAGLPDGRLPHSQPEPTDALGFVGGRILHPEWIDRRLPALWNDACSRLHDGVCKNALSQFSPSFKPTWLVDVNQMCIVQAPPGCSYVALSYVWGGVRTLLALKSNHEHLRCPGSLAMTTWDPPVSKTALDAMGVVKLLGERYLWVDALCIVQDEEERKQAELLKMSGIYAHATVTIIAAQGLSAESGLRGLQEITQPRDMRSTTHVLGDGTTVIQFPVSYQREMSSESSVWGERAWTFQEQLFSRRRLVFDGDSMRWECSKAIWREHVDWTTRLPTSKHNIDFPTLQSMLTAAVPNYNAFSAMLSNYNIREFTYPEDALDAFSGTLAACSSALGGDIISGLLSACFDAALL
jgi:hypothetical protein